MFRFGKITVILLVLLFALLLATFGAMAQESVTFGDTVEGAASGENVEYTLAVLESDIVVLLLESSEFDPRIALLDASGVEVTFDDVPDSGMVELTYSIPEAGDYTIVVSGADGAGPVGAYTLSVIGGSCIFDDNTADGNAIEYPLSIPEGDVVLIGIESEDFDPTLTVTNSAGEEVGFNDDSGGTLNSSLVFVSPADDTYTLTVNSFGTTPTEGDYAISVTGSESYQDSVTATTDYTTFVGFEGETLLISLISEEFDPLVRVNDSAGTELASDDDGGDGLNSLLEFNPPADDDYTFVVDSFTGAPSGAFQLDIFIPCVFEQEATGTPSVTGSIGVGETVTGTAAGSTVGYDIVLDAGQTVTIDLNSEEFDTYLRVNDASGTEIAFNDDVDLMNSNLNSQLEFTAPSSGTFTIVVDSFGGSPIGSYTLSVQ